MSGNTTYKELATMGTLRTNGNAKSSIRVYI
jgi:hypothetical protein